MFFNYEATYVGVTEENDVLIVGFGGLPDADGYPTASLVLQRSTDENEDEPGIRGVYAEWRDQGQSCYGCIKRFVLSRESVRVTFTPEANFRFDPNMEIEGEKNRLTDLSITLQLNDEKFAELKDRLEGSIFVDCECYSYVA